MRGRFAGGKRLGSVGGAGFFLFLCSLVPAFSDDQPSFDWAQEKYGWREVSGGIDAAGDQWLLYSGMTVAPWSTDIYGNGWRLRVGGGYGQFGYEGAAPRDPCGDATSNDACTETGRAKLHYDVEHSYAEALIGYHLRLGSLTAKAFAGAAMASERHLRKDPASHTDGLEFGAKGVLELWFDASPEKWMELDASYTTARDESSARWRAGWRLEPGLSVGPELRYDRNIQSADGEWNGRIGLFGRYEWIGGEVSISGGVTARVRDWSGDNISPYGTINVIYQY